jgi:hypothetical protein
VGNEEGLLFFLHARSQFQLVSMFSYVTFITFTNSFNHHLTLNPFFLTAIINLLFTLSSLIIPQAQAGLQVAIEQADNYGRHNPHATRPNQGWYWGESLPPSKDDNDENRAYRRVIVIIFSSAFILYPHLSLDM